MRVRQCALPSGSNSIDSFGEGAGGDEPSRTAGRSYNDRCRKFSSNKSASEGDIAEHCDHC
jgi:hypothetical protein